MKSWIRNLLKPTATTVRKAPKHSSRLRAIEQLEDRITPVISLGLTNPANVLINEGTTYTVTGDWIDTNLADGAKPIDLFLNGVTPGAPAFTTQITDVGMGNGFTTTFTGVSGPNRTGTWTYTFKGFDGITNPGTPTYKFSLQAKNTTDTSAVTDLFNVTVSNVTPVVGGAPDQIALTGSPATLSLGSFTDPGLDANWTVGIDLDNNGTFETSFTTASTGAISYTNTFATQGVYPINVRVTDKDGAISTVDQFIVTVSDNFAVVYVDDSFTQTNGQQIADADLSGPGSAGNQPATFGVNAFKTITAALPATTPGTGTIDVQEGTYAETVAINQGVRIVGPNEGISGSGTRVNEAVVTSPVANLAGTGVGLVRITANNVTIDGLAVDGDNTAISGGVAVLGGADSNARRGIVLGSGTQTVTGANITNSRIQNFYGRGVQFGFSDFEEGLLSIPSSSTSGTAQNNSFTGIGDVPGSDGYAVLAFDSTPNVTNNSIAITTNFGVYYQVVYPPNVSPITVSGNTIDAQLLGVAFNQTHSTIGTSTISGNTIATGNNGIGLLLWNIGNTLTVSGNSITGTGTGDIGMHVWNAQATLPTSINVFNSTISGYATGLEVTNKNSLYYDVPALDTSNVTLSGVTVNVPVGGTGLRATGDAVSKHDATITLNGTNTISATTGAIGIAIDGPQAKLGGTSLASTNFTGFSGSSQFVSLLNTAHAGDAIDGTTASYNGVLGSALTRSSTPSGFYVEDRITHALDDAGVGFVRTTATKVWVTTSTLGIQRGIDVASSGDTVFVQAGSYAESLDVNKPLSLIGPNDGKAGNAARDPEAVITSPVAIAQSLVDINATNVILDGFTVNGDAGIVGGVLLLDGLTSSNAARGITVDGDNAQVINNRVQNIYRRGVQFFFDGASAPLGGLAAQNDLLRIGSDDTLGGTNAGYAIISFFGNPSVNANTINEAHSGIYFQVVYPPNAAAFTVDNNNVTARDIGIAVNQTSSSIAATSLSGNTINTGAGSVGLLLWNIGNSLTVSGNTLNGSGGGNIGIHAWNAQATLPQNVIVQNSTISGYATGVEVTNKNALYYDTPALDDATITLSSVTINVPTGGTGVRAVGDAVSTKTANAILTGSSIIGGATGIQVLGALATANVQTTTIQGASAIGVDVDGGMATITNNPINSNAVGINFANSGSGSVTGNNFNDTTDNGTDIFIATSAGAVVIGAGNAFAGSSFFIQNQSAVDYDLSANATTFDVGSGDTLPAALTLADKFTVEQRLEHKPDNNAYGLITFVANTVYVPNTQTIQGGIDAVPDGSTGWSVIVQAGKYVEAVNVNESVSLIGPNAGISAGKTAGVRGAEATVTSPVANLTGFTVGLFSVTKNDVVIDGFAFDGDNTSLPGGVAVIGGADSNARRGVAVSAVSNTLIQNNIFVNLYGRGIQFDDVSGVPATGGQVIDNGFSNIGDTGGADGFAALAFDSTYDFVGNDVANTNIGPWYQFLYTDSTPVNVTGNAVSAVLAGIGINETGSNTGLITVSSNTFAVGSGGIGAQLWSIAHAAGTTFTNNIFTGSGAGSLGIYAWTATGAMTIPIDGGSISGFETGVLVANEEVFGPFGPATAASTVNLSNLAITPATGGTAVSVNDTAAGTTAVNVGLNNVTLNGAGNSTGLLLSGPVAKAVGNTLANTAFSGFTGTAQYVVLANGSYNGSTLDGQTADYDGVVGNTATLPQAFAIEDRITHQLDDAAQGFVEIQTATAFVTNASGSIQRGIDAEGLSAGGIVNIVGGTYVGNVSTAAAAYQLVPNPVTGVGPTTLTITGDLTLDGNDKLVVDINGLVAGTDYDQFVVSGTATLGGVDLGVSLGFVPALADQFTIVSAGSVAGAFMASLSPFFVVNTTRLYPTTTATTGKLTATPNAAPLDVFVDDSYAPPAVGTVVDFPVGGASGQFVYGYNVSNTIAGGQGLLGAGTTTVTVADGSYAEAVVLPAAQTLIVNNGIVTINSLSGPLASNLDINGFTLQTGDATSTTFDGLIAGSAASTLIKQGTGTFGLTADNSAFTGLLSVDAGTVDLTGKLGGDASISGTLTGSGTILGDVDVNAGGLLTGTLTVDDLTNDGTVSPAGAAVGTITAASYTQTAGGLLVLDVNGPVVTNDSIVVTTGNTVIDGTVMVNSTGAAISNFTSIPVINNTGAGTVSGNFVGLLNGFFVTAGANTFQIFYMGGDGNDVSLFTVPNAALQAETFADDDFIGPDGSAVFVPGFGTAYIGFNAFAKIQPALDRTTATGTVRAFAGNYAADSINFFANQQTFLLDTAAVVVVDGPLAGTDGGAKVLFSKGSLTVGDATSSSYAGLLSGLLNSTGFVKQGAGTFTISNPGNNYVGATRVTGGTLALGADEVIPNSSTVTLTGSTLDLDGFWETIGALAGGSTVDLGTGGKFSVGNTSVSTTFAGTITGTGDVVKQGAGTFTVSSSTSDFIGTTTVEAGTLQLGNGGSTGTLPGVINVDEGASLAINRSTVGLSVTNDISGAGRVVQAGSGSTRLAGTNTFTGGIVISKGTLLAGSNAELSTGDLTLTGAGTLFVDGSFSTGRSFTADNTSAIAVANGSTLTLSGATVDGGTFNGPGDIDATAGTVIHGAFVGPNGSLNVNASTLQSVSNGGSIAVSGTGNVLNSFANLSGGDLSVSGTASTDGFTNNGQVDVSGSLTNVGASKLIFGGGSFTNVTAAGLIDVGTSGGYASGARIRNAGNFGSAMGQTVIDFGARFEAVTGSNDSMVVSQNGGVIAPGASPGAPNSSSFTVNGGGTYEFELTDATGTPGLVHGWDVVNVVPGFFSPSSAELILAATPANKYNIQLFTRLDDGVGKTPGAAANFNSQLPYAWKFIDADDAATTISGSFDANAFNLITTGFANTTDGVFSVEARDGGQNLYIVYTPNHPAVTSVVVNTGDVQRSRLTTIDITFASPVDASTLGMLGGITLTRTAATPSGTVGTVVDSSNGLIVTPAVGMVTSVTVTFANVSNAGVEFGSLSDGRWQLAIPAALYTSTAGDTQLRRLFGDIDNNGTVDGPVDFSQFGGVFGTTPGVGVSPFDYDNNGTIDGSTDFAQFGSRFGITL